MNRTPKPAPSAPPRLKIKRLDSPYRWLVQSESDEDVWYGVDLLEHNKIGRCDCDHFKFRLEPTARDAKIPWDALRCKHLRIVRECLLNALLDSMDSQKYDDETKNRKEKEHEHATNEPRRRNAAAKRN